MKIRISDAIFKEDNCQIHNAADNIPVIRKLALNLIKRFKTEIAMNSSFPAIRKKYPGQKRLIEAF